MLENIRLDRVIFIDIETVSDRENYSQLSTQWKALWDKKASYFLKDDEKPEDIYSRAAIYAEFGKIICISVGLYRVINDKVVFRIKSYSGSDEKLLLESFNKMLIDHFESPDYLLCAHNGKEFDFPYIARRTLINGLKLPYLLDTAGRKPWEVQHLDTLHLWKFGDFKHYTSLDLLSQLFGIQSPKATMDGSDVGRVYYEEKNLKKIVEYCEHDVLTTAQLLLAFQGKNQLKKKEISISN